MTPDERALAVCCQPGRGTLNFNDMTPLPNEARMKCMYQVYPSEVADAIRSALEEAAKLADARAAICRDAQKLGPETLPNVEIHTALEAEHIAAAIRAMIK